MAATAALMRAGRALMVAAPGPKNEAEIREALYCDAHPATYDVPVDDVS
jgi:hypothetical protein